MANDVTKQLKAESHIGCKYYFNGRPDVEQVYEMLEDHVNDNNNPHKLTNKQIVGLENVDNTSDADKPISKAQKEYIDILKDEVDKLEARVKALQSTVITNRANIKTLNEKTFPDLEAEINEKFQSVVADLSEAITSAEKKEAQDIQNINDTLDTLKQTVEETETLIQLEQSLRASGDAQLRKSIDAMAQDVQTRISEALIEMTEKVSVIDERVAKVESKFAILVDMVETATEHFDEKIKEIDGKVAEVDERIAKAQEVIDDKIEQAGQHLDEEIVKSRQELQAMVQEFSQKLDAELEKFRAEIAEEFEKIHEEEKELKEAVEAKVVEMQEYVDSAIKIALDNMDVKFADTIAEYNRLLTNHEQVIDGKLVVMNEKVDNQRADLKDLIDHLSDDQKDFEDRIEATVNPIKQTAEKASQDVAQEVVDRQGAMNDLKIQLTDSLNASKVAQLNISRNLQTSDYTFTITTADGKTLAEDSINIPVDSVVQSGTYDPTTKSLILTLNNGNKITIPVAGLVTGLASDADLSAEIADRKLADVQINAAVSKEIDDRTAADLEVKAALNATISAIKEELLKTIADNEKQTAQDFKEVDGRLDEVELASQVLISKVDEVKSDVEKYFAKKSELNSVALSGDYEDLANTPVIPTVDVNKSYVDLQNTALNTKIINEVNQRELADQEIRREVQSIVDTAVETREDKFTGVLLNLKNTLQAGNIGYIKVIDGGSGAASSIVKTIDLADKLSHVFNYDNNETLTIDLDALKNL